MIAKSFKELSSIPQEFGVPSSNPQLEIPLSETLEKIKEFRADNFEKLKQKNPKLLHELNSIIDYLTKGDLEAAYKKKPFGAQALELHALNFENNATMDQSTAAHSKIMANKKRKKKKRKKHDSDSEESEKSFISPYDGDFEDFKSKSKPYQMLFNGNDKNTLESNLASLHMDMMLPGLTESMILQNQKLVNLHTNYLA